LETVRIPLERRASACASRRRSAARSAAASARRGRLGLARNLEAWEIVEQVLTVRRGGARAPVTGVVFQGQGEPFQNYDNVIRAPRILRHPCGLRLRGDRITISTVGLLRSSNATRRGHPYRLILSLTSRSRRSARAWCRSPSAITSPSSPPP